MTTRFFKRTALLSIFASLLLCGCASHYDVTLGNGDRIRASTKPQLNSQGYYVFKDLAGQETMVNKMRVRQIETVRRGSQPSKAF